MKRDSKKLADRLGISHEDCVRLYGDEGEFYFHEDGDMGQTNTDDIVNYNSPPSTQPGLWCDWTYNPQDNAIEWNGSEKTYDSEEWINYISKILYPRGYSLNGSIYYEGEELGDVGVIKVNGSQTVNLHGSCIYSIEQVNKMKVKDLREALRSFGESTEGTKPKLKERMINLITC